MARKKKKADVPAADWMNTYADTITLLLTFFILLYAQSSLDSDKARRISMAFTEMMTGNKGDTILEYDLYNGSVPLIGGESDIDGLQGSPGVQGRTYEEVKRFVEENDLNATVDITTDDRGIILQLRDSILFEPGKAALKSNSLEILDKINVLIATLPNSIIIEGHTDNVPVNFNEFESNWELSSARATKVLRYFTEAKGQNQNRFSANAYGDTKPLVPNTTAENKAQNRRVNILLVTNNKG